MKKIFLIIFIIGIIFHNQLYAQTATPPSAGDGTEGNPFQIVNLENLYWIAANSANWDKHYIQTADINAAETKNWFSGFGWKPIGDYDNNFTGIYNGQSYSIDSLFINCPYDAYNGLFGRSSGSNLVNINLNMVNVTSGGNSLGYIGALIGLSVNSNIYNCSSNGTVVSKSDYGEAYVGGLIGSCNGGNISNSFSTCFVTGISGALNPFTGGLIGYNEASYITNCFSAGKVTGVNPGGLIGNGGGDVTSFWDVETSGVPAGGYIEGKTTAEMRNINTFQDAGWDFDTVWEINSVNNFGYPFLKGQTFPQGPVVTTYSVNSTSLNTADVMGQITSIGDTAIYQHGVCWNLTGSPTVSDSKTQEGAASAIGFFISEMPNIYSGTTYHIRSYAYNSNGISYGNEIVFESESYPTAVPFGAGTELDPYEITSLSNLKWVKENSPSWDKYFIQTDNINALDTKNWNGGTGWKPVGDDLNQFTGVYDGQGHVIENLYINNLIESYQGLFGLVHEAELKNIYITLANINGIGNVGALAGFCATSSVFNCYSTGNVQGKYYAGGLIGENSSILEACRSGANVKGSIIGGLVGYNRGIISQSYSRGNVKGDDVENNMTGGLAGWNISEINNCFSASNVDDAGSGGLVGFNGAGSIIRNSFSFGAVSGRQSGGLAGFLEYKNSSEYCFWDVENSGLDSSATGTGLTTDQMKTKQTYLDASWNFEDIWDMDGVTNNGYPFLAWMPHPIAIAPAAGDGTGVNPYQIATFENLYWIAFDPLNWDKHYIQTDYIDASKTAYWFVGDHDGDPETPDEPMGWKPIGNSDNPFTGTYSWDANSNSLSYLFINRPLEDNIGLFGVTSGAFVAGLSLRFFDITGKNNTGSCIGNAINSYINFIAVYSASDPYDKYITGSINGIDHTGGLIGYSTNSTISNCFTGTIINGRNHVGGISGSNTGNSIIEETTSYGIVSGQNYTGGVTGSNDNSTIENCNTLSSVTGADYVGGLCAEHINSGIVKYTYNAGVISGNAFTGGLIGYSDTSSVTASFWDTETSGQPTSSGGEGKTTVEMRTERTYTDAGWDFEDLWYMRSYYYLEEYYDFYPFLWYCASGLENFDAVLPEKAVLYQNYPNPFNPVTTIKFSIPSDQDVKLSVYNSNGQLVNELINKKLEKGTHSVQFNAERLNSGIYFCRLDTDGKSLVNKMLLIK